MSRNNFFESITTIIQLNDEVEKLNNKITYIKSTLDMENLINDNHIGYLDIIKLIASSSCIEKKQIPFIIKQIIDDTELIHVICYLANIKPDNPRFRYVNSLENFKIYMNKGISVHQNGRLTFNVNFNSMIKYVLVLLSIIKEPQTYTDLSIKFGNEIFHALTQEKIEEVKKIFSEIKLS
jgi:hypothetical protein